MWIFATRFGIQAVNAPISVVTKYEAKRTWTRVAGAGHVLVPLHKFKLQPGVIDACCTL